MLRNPLKNRVDATLVVYRIFMYNPTLKSRFYSTFGRKGR